MKHLMDYLLKLVQNLRYSLSIIRIARTYVKKKELAGRY